MTKSKFIESLEAMFRAIGVELSDDAPSKPELSANVVTIEDEADAPVEFKSASSEGRVEWSGRLFRAIDAGLKGKYGPEELRGFVANFPASGVPIRDTHPEKNTFFNELLKLDNTRVSRVWVNDDATELHGTFDAPSWLQEGIKDKLAKKVSIGLTQDRKALREVSLVLNPHIEDAAVFEREMAAAVLAAPSFSNFAASHPEDARLVTEAAKAPVPPPAMLTKEQKTTEAKQAYAALPQFMRDAQTEAQFVALATEPVPPAQTPAGDPALLQRIADLEAQQATFTAKREEEEDANAALGFYADHLQKGKVVPAEREFVLATFNAARAADRAKGVTFSANAEGSHEATIRKAYEARPAQFRMGPGVLDSHADVPAPEGSRFGGLDAHFAAEDASKEKK